jgi:hypothetical protein
MREGPTVACKRKGRMAGFSNNRVAQDLHLVIGDELVAKSRKIQGQRDEE